jgi:UDP-N-acetylglucosamine acyltransferase
MNRQMETQIHPTAIIESGASLGPGVVIGPYAIIGSQAQIGAGCRIQAHAQVINDVQLGEDCLVGRGAVLGDDPQSISFDPSTPSSLQIGARNQFREHVTVHRGAKEGSATVIGSDNYFMVGCHVGHDAVIGNRNIIANACLLGGHVVVGDRAFLGGGAGFHQFTRIGDLAMVQGNAIVNRDVPPYVIAGAQSQLFGLNTIGLRRAGISAERRDDIKRAFHLVFRGDLNLSQALASAEEREWSEEAGRLLDFLRAPSHQGICRVRSRGSE